MKLKTRIIAFILMLLTAFYAVPVSAFAKAAFSDKPGEKSESSSAEVQASCTNSSSGFSESEVSNHYSYNDNGSIETSYTSLGNRLTSTYAYDDYERLKSVTYGVSGGFKNVVTMEYRSNSTYLSPSQIVSYTSTIGETVPITTNYSYTYDERGNITGITADGHQTTYVYDDLGQLVRENNQTLGKTFVYTYDNAGNILTKKTYNYTTSESLGTPTSTDTYGYSTGAWGDQLTSYNGATITYDDIGNPRFYNNGTAYSFEWQGRQLMSATKGGVTSTFKYNPDGLRTEKTVGTTVKHTYYYTGTQLLAEQWAQGNVEYLMVFLYDSFGSPVGIAYRTSDDDSDTWTNYWFERNLQGDVVAIYNNSGTKLATYTYDAWGNHNLTYYNGGGSIVPIVNNPIRYRGYYYDIDLGFYYLQTRYYDAKLCRFINPDSIMSGTNGSLHGFNLYVYCFNNPVNLNDSTGNWPSWNDIVSNAKKAAAWVNNNVIQPVAKFANDIKEDYNNYSKYNTDVSKVFESNYFSSYKGTIVIKTHFDASFSYGFIGLSRKQQTANTLNHEYGHILQLENMGWEKYIVDVTIPSLTINILDRMEKLPYDYYTYPFEAEANKLGGSTSSQQGKRPLPQGGYTSYWDLIPLFFKWGE